MSEGGREGVRGSGDRDNPTRTAMALRLDQKCLLRTGEDLSLDKSCSVALSLDHPTRVEAVRAMQPRRI